MTSCMKPSALGVNQTIIPIKTRTSKLNRGNDRRASADKAMMVEYAPRDKVPTVFEDMNAFQPRVFLFPTSHRQKLQQTPG